MRPNILKIKDFKFFNCQRSGKKNLNNNIKTTIDKEAKVVRKIISIAVLISTPKAEAKIMLNNIEGMAASIMHTLREIPESPSKLPNTKANPTLTVLAQKLPLSQNLTL